MLKKFLGIILLVPSLLWAKVAPPAVVSIQSTNFDECTAYFPNNTPTLRSIPGFQLELCYDGFATLYSYLTKTPVYSVARFHADGLQYSLTSNRKDVDFFEDTRIPEAVRSTLKDYKDSGFDRGHLIPNGSAMSYPMQLQTFSLANVAPQLPRVNRELWSKLEQDVRRYIRRTKHDVVVFVGTHYKPAFPMEIGNGVAVPDAFWMLVIDETNHTSFAHYLENAAGAIISGTLTKKQLIERLQFNPLAGMD